MGGDPRGPPTASGLWFERRTTNCSHWLLGAPRDWAGLRAVHVGGFACTAWGCSPSAFCVARVIRSLGFVLVPDPDLRSRNAVSLAFVLAPKSLPSPQTTILERGCRPLRRGTVVNEFKGRRSSVDLQTQQC